VAVEQRGGAVSAPLVDAGDGQRFLTVAIDLAHAAAAKATYPRYVHE
jgi:hypothetical protein